LSLEAILHRIVQDAAELLECESVGILLLDDATHTLRFVAATLFQDQLLDIPVPLDASIAGAAFTSAQPVIVNNVTTDPRYYARVGETTGVAARSLLAVPLQFRDHKIGVLEAENKKRKRNFDELDTETLTALAVQTTIAIENARLYERAQREIAAREQAEDELRRQRDQVETRAAHRTRELAALYDVSAIATRAQNQETLFHDSLARARTALECPVGVILLATEKNKATEPTRWRIVTHFGLPPDVPVDRELTSSADDWFAMMSAQRQPVLISDVSTDPRVPEAMHALGARALLLAPLLAEEQVIGVIGLLRDARQGFSIEEITLLSIIAGQLSIGLQGQRVRQLAQQAALMAERQRLARDLHDSVTQSLYSVTLFAQAIRSSASSGNLPLMQQYVSRISEMAQQALKEMRWLIYELRPAVVQELGLVEALRRRLEMVERRAGVQTEFVVDGAQELDAPLENAVYQIVQEALNNILKHSSANYVTLRMRMAQRELQLEINDDGKGFNPAANQTMGLGLDSMRERAAQLGGALTILSKPGQGTRVRLSVPFDEEQTT
jgi:signal transduction histidine kinase